MSKARALAALLTAQGQRAVFHRTTKAACGGGRMNGNVMTQINPTLLAVHITERIEALKDLVKSLPDSGEHKLLQSMLDGLAQEHQALLKLP